MDEANKTKLEELDEIFMQASKLISSSRLLVPEDTKNLYLDWAKEGLLSYLKWMYKFLKEEQGFDH